MELKINTMDSLNCISPIDGRYVNKTANFKQYFSESALIKYRLITEVEYFIALCQIPLPQLKGFDHSKFCLLRDVYRNFSDEDALRVKEIEKVTNHDVKAVEYFLKENFVELELSEYKEFIHFGLTSQDVNNTAVPASLKDALHQQFYPLLKEVVSKLKMLSEEWKDISMLARTHGQPASPTKLGKEIYVFYERMQKQILFLAQIPFSAKFGGATGNFNAHHVAYPEIDWVKFGNHFVNNILGLDRSQTTTQIEHYDNLAAMFDNLKRINTILIDLCRDFWTYISMEYFKQQIAKGEVGSSAMPHKVNPIDFENAEGNFGIANALFDYLSSKLPISRLQRDLTDSTVLRNIGVPIAHSAIGLSSVLKGLGKLIVNNDAIKADLGKNIVVVSEAIQTILRREGYPNPYEALKELTRTNVSVKIEDVHNFIETLNVDKKIKEELKQISAENYTGIDLI